MPNGKKEHFELLKKKIVATMQQSYPGINPSISEWKGQEITDFQEELLKTVNAHISEKWFYNHIKKGNQTLPRIDVLNLLSKFAGFSNWDDFVYKNSEQVTTFKPGSKANRYFILLPIMLLVAMFIFFLMFKLFTNREYRISFYDALTREPITGSLISVKVLSESGSPAEYLSDSAGTLVFKTDKRVVKMLVHVPYYKKDTITREMKSFEKDQKIGLTPDDYAMVLHYFSETKPDEWTKRRAYLENIIDDNALIYQVHDGTEAKGMELYNKPEFIDRMTLPTGTLRNIEILETRLKNDKIFVLRFRVKEVRNK